MGLDCLPDQPLNRREVGHIDLDGLGAALPGGDARGHVPGQLDLAVGQDHLRATPGQLFGQRPANARGCARDNSDRSVKCA